MKTQGQSAVFLSVVVVTYRSEKEIGACLASIPPRLNGGEVETIVVDNSPDEATAELIASQFPSVMLIRTGVNVGFGKANNRGLSQARGKFVLFLNPDTVSNTAAYEACIQILEQDPRAGLVTPRLVMADGRMDLAARRSVATAWDGFCRAAGLAACFPKWKAVAGYNLTYKDERGTYEVGSINGAFMLGRRGVIDGLGGFDEAFFMYCEDLDLCMRVTRAGYKNIYHGAVDVVHLKGSSSAQESGRMSRELFVGARRFYLKHFNPENRRLVRWKYGALFWLWEKWANCRRALRRDKRVRPA